MQQAKIYGVCLERVSELIGKAKKRLNGCIHGSRVLLESYHTCDLDDIIYILELYDIEEHTQGGLRKELEYVASAISDVTGETLTFGYTETGHLGLYLRAGQRTARAEEFAGVFG